MLRQSTSNKNFYLDHYGNMSSSSSNSSNMNTTGACVLLNGSLVRKQILPLKPKQTNTSNYVQHLEHKTKKVDVPVTNLELKKREKLDKNVVTKLVYRKPSIREDLTSSSNEAVCDRIDQGSKRPATPSSSGYETDSVVDLEQQQENLEFAQLVENTFNAHFSMNQPIMQSHQLDMIHAHPVWAPQTNLFNFNLS